MRVTVKAEDPATGIGRLGSDEPTIGGKRREVVRAGEGGVGRERLLPKSESFRPRADAVPCGMPRADCGDEEIRAQQPEESEEAL